MKLSVIIPVLNEAGQLPAALQPLQAMRGRGHEVILVDGGSEDEGVELARPYVDKLVISKRGRAVQMNAGAAVAGGDVLLFLHVDTRLGEGVEQAVSGAVWGFFRIRLSGGHYLFRLIETGMNWRSRWSSVATGDQCLFVRREQFEAMQGFAPIPLMEDVEMCKRLRRVAAPVIIRQQVVTSSRRWEQQGIVRTILKMWWLRLAWFCGRDPARLARQYE
ncbi:MAG: TIGR04283 family arsenosugar biosynthesis glycosyltransferase [Gammaproteobacteria bacterium]